MYKNCECYYELFLIGSEACPACACLLDTETC